MRIETSWNIADTVYAIHDNKIEKFKIKTIEIIIREKDNEPWKITYELFNEKHEDGCIWLYGDDLFTTKEYLLKSL